MKKRMVSSTLAMLLMVSMLLACMPNALADATGGLVLPLVDKPTTVTLLCMSPFQNLSEKQFFQELKVRTGIEVVVQSYTEDVFNEKVSTIIASGDLPDITVGALSLEEFNSYGEQGAFANVMEYVAELPNFKKIFIDDAVNNQQYNTYTTESGSAYILPIYGLNRDVNHGFMYRADIFEKLGLTPWTDTESFYQNMKALKEAYPDSFPYGSKNGVGIFLRWVNYFGLATTNSKYPFYYDEETSKWKNGATDPKFKEMLDFMQKLYVEGLLDPEFLTDTQDSWAAKVTNDKTFIMNDWIGRMALFNSQMQPTNAAFNLAYGRPIGLNKHFALDKFAAWGALVANNENSLTSLKLLDYLYSDEGSELNTIGIEGVTFNWDENGKPVYPELADASLVDIKLLEDKYGLWVQGLYLRPDHRSIYYTFTENEQYAQDLINNEVGFLPVDPAIKLSDSDSEAFGEITLALQKELEVFESNYVVDSTYGEDKWNQWVADIDSKYSEKALAILNK